MSSPVVEDLLEDRKLSPDKKESKSSPPCLVKDELEKADCTEVKEPCEEKVRGKDTNGWSIVSSSSEMSLANRLRNMVVSGDRTSEKDTVRWPAKTRLFTSGGTRSNDLGSWWALEIDLVSSEFVDLRRVVFFLWLRFHRFNSFSPWANWHLLQG